MGNCAVLIERLSWQAGPVVQSRKTWVYSAWGGGDVLCISAVDALANTRENRAVEYELVRSKHENLGGKSQIEINALWMYFNFCRSLRVTERPAPVVRATNGRRRTSFHSSHGTTPRSPLFVGGGWVNPPIAWHSKAFRS
jgi:hypothetical protein